jgi:hypothetical protein
LNAKKNTFWVGSLLKGQKKIRMVALELVLNRNLIAKI